MDSILTDEVNALRIDIVAMFDLIQAVLKLSAHTHTHTHQSVALQHKKKFIHFN